LNYTTGSEINEDKEEIRFTSLPPNLALLIFVPESHLCAFLKVDVYLNPMDSRDEIEMIDNKNGTYTIYFKTFVAQNYEIIVEVDGEPIPESPFGFSTVPGSLLLFKFSPRSHQPSLCNIII